jgi:hypothetical protein
MAKKIKRWFKRKFGRRRRAPWGGPYIKPLVERVKLDPEQAILTSCMVGGAYMDGPTQVTNCKIRGAAAACSTQVRGIRTNKGVTRENRERPS